MSHLSSIPLTGALALAACLGLLLPDPAAAETYQWTDKDGNVGFTDSLEKVPPQYRQSAKRLEETKESTKSFQKVPTPPSRNNMMPSAPTDQGDPSAVLRQRMTAARAEQPADRCLSQQDGHEDGLVADLAKPEPVHVEHEGIAEREEEGNEEDKEKEQSSWGH